jgi:hypothetical protein
MRLNRVFPILLAALAFACSDAPPDRDDQTDGGGNPTDGGGDPTDGGDGVQPVDCNAAACASGAQTCQCLFNDECAPGFRCTDNHLCECGERGSGAFNAACSSNNQCDSGLCVLLSGNDGFCTRRCSGSSGCSGVLSACDDALRVCVDEEPASSCNDACSSDGTGNCACYGNSDCSPAFRCSDDLLCVCGSRGTGAFESNCTSNNQCASGSCVLLADEVSAKCSKDCQSNAQCNGSVLKFCDVGGTFLCFDE